MVSPVPVEFQPYRVVCLLAADPDEVAAQTLGERLANELPMWLSRMMGQRWQVDYRWEPDAAWAARGRLIRMTAAELSIAEDADIVYRIAIRREGHHAGGDVQAFEPLFQHISPARIVVCPDERELSGRCAAEVLSLFRPRAVWESRDERTVRLRVQGAALAAGEPDHPMTAAGEVFAPWIIFRNRERQVQRTQEFPWTYLQLAEIEDGRGTAEIVSGLRNPLGVRPRGRVDLIAVAVRPQWPESTIEVIARASPPRPLPAHRLELTPVDAAADAPPEPVKLLTDRAGRVRLPRGEPPALQWMRITSGDLLLAKVPIYPGATPLAQLELPDDQLRLKVEGDLKVLQGDVISVVAQRAALVASARAAAKLKQWDDAKLRLRQLDQLPTPQSFKERVSAIRVPGVTAARQQKDKIAEQRINRLCNDTEELVQHYLTDEKIKQLRDEITELESAAKID